MDCLVLVLSAITSSVCCDCGCIHIPARGTAKRPLVKQETVDSSPVLNASPTSLQISKSPIKGEQKLLVLQYKLNQLNCHIRRDARPTWLFVTVDLFVTGKNKAKKGKHMSAVAPLQDGEMLTDTTGKKWTPVKLLSQSTTELTYEGETKNTYAPYPHFE